MNSGKSFQIGKLQIGGQSPILVQSMTNTDTADVDATVQQCIKMIDSGAQMVRITVPSLKETDALKKIKTGLREAGFPDIPLIADVHFNPKVAEEAAKIVDKVRVNPGNFTDKRNFLTPELSESEFAAAVERMALRAKPLIDICKEHGTAIRIGINHGSLCDRIVNRYGNTPEAMVRSAMEWLDICRNYSFDKVVLSMKSSNVLTMMKATTLLYQEMKEQNMEFPLHLGVTEAGNGIEGRAKSAAGIGGLLLGKVGDTVRVSLTEQPENESPFAHKLIESIQNIDTKELKINNGTLYFDDDETDFERFLCKAASAAGFAHFNFGLRAVKLKNNNLGEEEICRTENTIMQACRIRITNTEFVACPSCGRTQYDIQSVLAAVKKRFSGFPNLKIGVMGCIVNGPGEMADADFGIVGASHGLVCVYEGKQRASQPVDIDTALNLLDNILKTRYLQ